MTSRLVRLRDLTRVWCALLVIAIILVLGAAFVHSQSSVWTGRVEVMMLPPSDGSTTLTQAGTSLVDFAAIVERGYSGAPQPDRFASETATMWGAGITEGQRVFLSNSGGQWADNFSRPVIIVEAVSHDRLLALARLRDTTAELVARVSDLQTDVPTSERITVLESPRAAAVEQVGGSRVRSYAAVVLLALGGGVAADWTTVRVRRRIRRHEEAQARLVSSLSQTGADPDRVARDLAEISA